VEASAAEKSLKIRQIDLGLTQEQIAEATGLGQNTVSRVLAGKVRRGTAIDKVARFIERAEQRKAKRIAQAGGAGQ
jgi:transcriptional regulator with XRE-family HTH domain